MPTLTQELHSFLSTLNDEADVATAALRELLGHPHAKWKDVLEAHPEWCRFGTFEALLSEANAELYRDPRVAQTIIELVLSYAGTLKVDEGAELLKPLLTGLALKEYANARYTQEDYDGALETIEKALQTFADQPALEVERAAALLVYAQVLHKKQRTTDELNAIRDAAKIFEDHYHYRRQEMALEICGEILMEQKEFLAAQEVYQAAYAVAERLIDDPIAMLRLDNNLGLCALYLHDLEEARYRLTKAFTGFEQRRLYGAMHPTLFNLAREARARGEWEEALETMHDVYAQCLDRNMPRAAAQVLVELADVVTELTQKTVYAGTTCRRLAEMMIADDRLPSNIRDAVEYLRNETGKPLSVPVMREVFDKVRKFLLEFAGSPTVAFAV